MRDRSCLIVGLALVVCLVPAPLLAGDSEAAERQYKVARRLAAEGAEDAAAALRKVVELDPSGPLADDALLEEALLVGPARWPEQLGLIDAGSAGRALVLIQRVLEEFAGADRASEARYYQALLHLEPIQLHDATAAKFDVISVATEPLRSEWTLSARYVGAFIAEQAGMIPRARSAFQRVLVEAPYSDVATRARVGLARLLVREGEFGPAAALLKEAIDAGADPALHAEALKELAVRSMLREAGETPGGELRTVSAQTGVKSPEAVAATPDGGLLIADRKGGAVVLLDAAGKSVMRWNLEEPQAVAANRFGRLYAAAGDRVYRLERDGRSTPLAALDDYAPLSALVADSLGRLWLLDRKGERLGRLMPGQQTPTPAWQSRGAKLTAICWDGRRLVAIDDRDKGLLTILEDGSQQSLVSQGFQKPSAIASDPAGTLAVLDSKAGAVVLVRPDGERFEAINLRAAAVKNVAGIAQGIDGTLNLLDASTGAWVKR